MKGKFEIGQQLDVTEGSMLRFLRTGVIAAVLSGRGKKAETRDVFMKWEIVADMTEWHFRREVRAGSCQQDEELDFKINSD